MANPDLIFLHAPSVYDFRRESILYGPVSDLVPSTPVFEMYPIGFTTIAEYLDRYGFRTRIVNLAVRMLEDITFDAEAFIARLDAAVFGIDLHWLPHAHGSIEVARIVKRLHPNRPVLFGGFSSTYFHTELINYPAVDFILRGDSTEEPVLHLMRYITSGGRMHPAAGSIEAQRLERIANLVWKDDLGEMHVNPLTYSPETLDHVLIDYSQVVKGVGRYFDLASVKPFRNWMKYPITAALTVRGCRYNCVTCGGSACTFRSIHNRQRPAYRSPEDLVHDIRRIGAFSNGPVMILGDIRQAGDDYANRLLDLLNGYDRPIFLEFFDAPPKEFWQKVSRSLPNWTVEISMESHDERVRRAFGRPYSNVELERSIDEALNAGCRRFDLFFMVGIKEQTYDSVMETVEYSRQMLKHYAAGGETRVIPFISPMAPFLDPGSRAFEEPDKHGFKLHARTLEEHRRLLLAPSWKYVLNYETRWMDRHQIVAATYESARRLNLIKGEYGVIDAQKAAATDQRITQAVSLIAQIDQIVAQYSGVERRERLMLLKQQVDNSNLSTVCDKDELELPVHGARINVIQAAAMIAEDWWKGLTRRISE